MVLDYMVYDDDFEFLKDAIRAGNLERLKALYASGIQKYDFACADAAHYGKLDCLKFLHKTGFPWYDGVTLSAAASGHLDCLQYAIENGCPWDEEVAEFAAKEGNLECLIYLHGISPYWCEKFFTKFGRPEFIMYAVENGLTGSEDFEMYEEIVEMEDDSIDTVICV